MYRIPPQFGEKIQKTIHPQPMGGQGGYAFVSLQNQGYLMTISTSNVTLWVAIARNTKKHIIFVNLDILDEL